MIPLSMTNLIKLLSYKRNGGSYLRLILHKITKGKIHRSLLNSRQDNITHSARRINLLMHNSDYKYLEIGVAYGLTLEGVKSNYKFAVDPNPKYKQNKKTISTYTLKMNSNEFFESLAPSELFSVIFLDGLHTKEQLLLDFLNSIKHINEDSWILIDDVVPRDRISAIPDLDKSYSLRKKENSNIRVWQGDCYKIMPILKKYFPEFHQFLIIYPDNPQLLVRLRRGAKLPIISNLDIEKYMKEMDSFQYLELFTSQGMSIYDLWVEDHLFANLNEQVDK